MQALAQCHVVLGILMLILSALADYVSSRIKTVRLNGLEECCSFYFIVMGLVLSLFHLSSIKFVSTNLPGFSLFQSGRSLWRCFVQKRSGHHLSRHVNARNTHFRACNYYRL